jgi:pimeloyl-ACP methyl ester carboxylesterase
VSPDIAHRQVHANGVDFHVAISGPEGAPPILCLHGFPEGWISWRAVMGGLTEARIYAPDLPGYPGSSQPRDGYDVMSLTDDIRALIEVLGVEKPMLVGHDWGGELGWIFAHRFSDLISRLVVINGTHPATLVRAMLHNDDFQAMRVPFVLFFQIPWFPEWFMTTAAGRRLLRFSFLVREGTRGTMDRALVDEIISHFEKPGDIRGPVTYYRQFFRTLLVPRRRRQLNAVYATPVTVPSTMVWGLKDWILPAKVAQKSEGDAGCPVEWRPLPGIGHFVDLEAPGRLVEELRRLITSPAGPA